MSVFENPILVTSLPAGADLSSSQYLVLTNNAGNAELAGVADIPYGILQNKPDADGTASLMQVGISRAIAGAAIALNAAVASDANGKLRTAVAGDTPCGRALESASADGDVICILLNIAGAAL